MKKIIILVFSLAMIASCAKAGEDYRNVESQRVQEAEAAVRAAKHRVEAAAKEVAYWEHKIDDDASLEEYGIRAHAALNYNLSEAKAKLAAAKDELTEAIFKARRNR